MTSGSLRDSGAGQRRSGEADVINPRMRSQCGACFRAIAGHDVERACGKTDLCSKLGHAQQREAGILGRLDDTRVAGRERGSDAAAEDLHRVVPRNDVTRDAMRLANRQHGHAGLVRDRLAVQLVGGARVVLEVACERGGIGAPLPERLAGGARFELRQLLACAFDCGRQLHQQPSALGRRQAAPVAVAELAERGTRGIDRTVDVGSIAAGDACECCANRRIERVDRLAVVRRKPAIADEVLCSRADFAIERSVHARSSLRLSHRLFQQGQRLQDVAIAL